jgi:CHAT domain-containing protein
VANRWKIGITTILILVGLMSIGLLLVGRDPYSEREIHRIIDATYNRQRPGGGRLSAAVYTALEDHPLLSADLGRAQLLLLRQPDSRKRQQLQGLVYLAAGEWQNFVELTNSLPDEFRNEAAILNNYGVCLLALSEKDPTLVLKALDALNQSAQLDPKAPEPLFNLVITYKKLRLSNLAKETLHRYSALDPSSEWQKEITQPNRKDERSIVEKLEGYIDDNDLRKAEQLFQSNPELCRRVAMQSALFNEPESPAVLHFIATQMEQRYGDKTVSAMLAPLFTDQRQTAIAVRRLVNRGASFYADGDYSQSLSAYARAAELARTIDSTFDRLWIDLNRVDTDIRLSRLNAGRDTLSRIVKVSESQGFLWLKAKALSIYGFRQRLASTYMDTLNLLSIADQEFVHLDAPRDRIRVLYYLSAYRYFGGDQEQALRFALECLRLVEEEDVDRISTFDWLIGSILYRRGMFEKSFAFATESVAQSHKARYSGGVGIQTSISLANLYQATSQYALAEQYLNAAEKILVALPDGFDRIQNELQFGIVKAKIKINEEKYAEAEALLRRNLDLYSQQSLAAGTPLLSPTLMLLGQVYSKTGRNNEAATKITEAIDVVEKDDEYMKSESFRVKFDDERRDLYDTAIDFEFKHGSPDAAWQYLQKYRAKLFLEFLAAVNPNVASARARLDRAEIQRHLPKDTQIVEYALLKDRLVIWIVSDKLFTVRFVPITRNELEEKVQNVLQKLRTEDAVDLPLRDVSKFLIDPISDLLDPTRSLTVIPDRALHGLPFEALNQQGKSHYLIEDFPIVISPSLTHFLTSNSGQPVRNGIVGFGSQNGGSSEFKELSALSKIYPKATTFLGKEVDKSSFLGGLEKATVFHYAGHSVTDAVDPLRSAILLDGNRSGPNSVTAIDISQQRLVNNAVVILSSCDSSVGNSRDGIGVRGLTSAFLIGGAGSVVGSLWLVEASSTADLMIRFHRAFAQSGMPVAKALREAQLAFMKAFPERSHPYYWSGFVVTGNVSALR